MKSLFSTYLELGFKHISDITAYDHIIFIIALCAIYKISEWKKILILVTAFTIGHSLTLGLAAMDLIRFPQKTIELLIPVTIFITALYNVFKKETTPNQTGIFNKKLNINYGFALFFGLIHGMGFSTFFRSSILPGMESQLLQQLLAFNIGVEVGQLLIVSLILCASYVALSLGKVKQREWNLFISGAAAGISVILFIGQLTA